MPADVARALHPACFACGCELPGGLGLDFERRDDGSVEGRFDCSALFQGYQGRLHGGIIATVLDAAMTHCLFSQQLEAVTARLEVRYRNAVELGVPAEVQARVTERKPPLLMLHAELRQQGRVCAVAKATFFLQKDLVIPRAAE